MRTLVKQGTQQVVHRHGLTAARTAANEQVAVGNGAVFHRRIKQINQKWPAMQPLAEAGAHFSETR